MKIRVGYELVYDFPQATLMIMVRGTHFTRSSDIVVPDHLNTSPAVPIHPYRDVYGNWCRRSGSPAVAGDRGVSYTRRFPLARYRILDAVPRAHPSLASLHRRQLHLNALRVGGGKHLARAFEMPQDWRRETPN